MKPGYLMLKSNHYSSEFTNPSYVSSEKLYNEIGYDINDLIKQNAGYANTCATRMSLALIKSGVNFDGRLKIKDGTYKNRFVEPGAKLLADQLIKPTVFGRPLMFNRPSTVPTELKDKKGVVFFWKIDGYDGGHIDLIESSTSAFLCNSHCYFACKEVWFWALS
jgi:hypothetical protein